MVGSEQMTTKELQRYKARMAMRKFHNREGFGEPAILLYVCGEGKCYLYL